MANAHVRCSTFCLNPMTRGAMLAMFTAECGHSFHFLCIRSYKSYGNNICPICFKKWNYTYPTPQIYPNPNPFYHTPNWLTPEPQFFSDDDPLLPNTTPNSHHPQITIKSHTEYPAIPAPSSSSSFAVLIRVIAPPGTSHRAPIDLVLVLDVSGSMVGPKLTLLKQAVKFVIENLESHDRLSIVIFSTDAQRVYPLKTMSSSGKEEAINVVNSLSAGGGTNILAGMQKGIRVLHERREKNPVTSVLLLSDGQDNARAVLIIAAAGAIGPGIPVHTFGFGTDHVPTLLHGVAERTGGTFSFIESVEIISEAFARCVGGLLSVVAKDLTIRLWTVSNGVRIVRIPAVASQVRSGGEEGVIKIDGMLYADEEKQYLVYLRVPRVELDQQPNNEEEIIITKLLDPSCEYKEPNSTAATSQQEVITVVEGETAKIQRPSVFSLSMLPDTLVAREKNRLAMVDDIGRAQSMADSGDLLAARSLLEQRAGLLRTAAGNDLNHDYYASLLNENAEIKKRMECNQMYQTMGRAYILSWLSAQGLQRATTRGGNAQTGSGSGYDTPGMLAMVKKCKEEMGTDYDAPQMPAVVVKNCKDEMGTGNDNLPPMAKKCKIEKN